jgi:hypothetical protein
MARWFGPKEIGYGVGPRSWQGWLATAVLLMVIVASRFVHFETFGLPNWTRAALIGAAVLGYLALTFFTYEGD